MTAAGAVGGALAWPRERYRCIVADPPWPQQTVGRWAKHRADDALPYLTLSIAAIAALPVAGLADDVAHLWLWTTYSHLRDAFAVMEAWGATYLSTVTWVKPSGFGAWFANTTQHVLFGYYGKCVFNRDRYLPTHFVATARRYSEKPAAFYALVRRISDGPALDLFSRRDIPGFDLWGNEAPTERQLPLEVPA